MILGIILDSQSRQYLLERVPPIHPKVFAHHVTLVFKPSPEQLELAQPLLLQNTLVEVTEYYQDIKGQAVTVKVDPVLGALNANQQHHITISCADLIPPIYSNDLISSISIPHWIVGAKLLGRIDKFHGNQKPNSGTGH